jgi:hypothetical protein
MMDEQDCGLVFDHHPTVTMPSVIKNAGANTADELLASGFEEVDMRQQTGEPTASIGSQ